MWKVSLEGCHAQVFSYRNLSNFERLYVKIFTGTGYKFYIENGKWHGGIIIGKRLLCLFSFFWLVLEV